MTKTYDTNTAEGLCDLLHDLRAERSRLDLDERFAEYHPDPEWRARYRRLGAETFRRVLRLELLRTRDKENPCLKN